MLLADHDEKKKGDSHTGEGVGEGEEKIWRKEEVQVEVERVEKEESEKRTGK